MKFQFVPAEVGVIEESLRAPVAGELWLCLVHCSHVNQQLLGPFVLGGARSAFEHLFSRVSDLNELKIYYLRAETMPSDLLCGLSTGSAS